MAKKKTITPTTTPRPRVSCADCAKVYKVLRGLYHCTLIVPPHPNFSTGTGYCIAFEKKK